MVEWASSSREGSSSSRTGSVAGPEGLVVVAGRGVAGGAGAPAEGGGDVQEGGEKLEVLEEDCWGREVTRLNRRTFLACPAGWRRGTGATCHLPRSREVQPGRRGRLGLEM